MTWRRLFRLSQESYDPTGKRNFSEFCIFLFLESEHICAPFFKCYSVYFASVSCIRASHRFFVSVFVFLFHTLSYCEFLQNNWLFMILWILRLTGLPVKRKDYEDRDEGGEKLRMNRRRRSASYKESSVQVMSLHILIYFALFQNLLLYRTILQANIAEE